MLLLQLSHVFSQVMAVRILYMKTVHFKSGDYFYSTITFSLLLLVLILVAHHRVQAWHRGVSIVKC